MGLVDKQVVKVRIGAPGRELIFENVVARVSASYAAECHIDYDEGNACGIGNGCQGEIIKQLGWGEANNTVMLKQRA